MIRRSSATGDVTSSNSWVGGLLGSAGNVVVERSFASGSVTGSDVVGGLLGSLGAYDSKSAVIDSYARGDVNGGGPAGGLIGQLDADGGGTWERCWPTPTRPGR